MSYFHIFHFIKPQSIHGITSKFTNRSCGFIPRNGVTVLFIGRDMLVQSHLLVGIRIDTARKTDVHKTSVQDASQLCDKLDTAIVLHPLWRSVRVRCSRRWSIQNLAVHSRTDSPSLTSHYQLLRLLEKNELLPYQWTEIRSRCVFIRHFIPVALWLKKGSQVLTRKGGDTSRP